MRRRRHVRHEVEVLEDPREQGHRRDPLGADVEQAHERAEDAGLQGGERHERADRHAAGGRGQAGREVDQRGDHGEDDLHRRHPPAAGQLRAQLEVDELVGGGTEPLGGARRRAEGLGQPHAADRQPLLDLVVEVGQVPLLGGGHRAAQQRDLAGQPQRRRDDEQREQRQPPRQRDHRDGGGDGGREVRGDRGRGRGDDALHPVDVVGQARLHLAGPGAGEEAERLALQVREDRGAQLVHHPLADLGRQPGLHHAEQLGHDRDGDHRADGTAAAAATSCCGSATSTTSRTRNGCARATTLVTTMIATTRATRRAVAAEQRQHPRQGHRGLGELGAVARVDAHGATAPAATATTVGCRARRPRRRRRAGRWSPRGRRPRRGGSGNGGIGARRGWSSWASPPLGSVACGEVAIREVTSQ